jgi:hypothetical protein
MLSANTIWKPFAAPAWIKIRPKAVVQVALQRIGAGCHDLKPHARIMLVELVDDGRDKARDVRRSAADPYFACGRIAEEFDVRG